MTTPTVSLSLRVSEIFGPTFQGEGPSVGRVAAFVRLMRCNLDCVWCDTPYTWDLDRFDLDAETRVLPVAEAADQALATNAPLVVITGGEPLLQAAAVVDLTHRLVRHGRRVEIETNGTITPPPELLELAFFNVSPKLEHSGVRWGQRIKPAILRAFAATERAVFKFVVRGRDDLDEIAALVTEHRLAPVWVMPEATSATDTVERMRDVADAALDRGYCLSPRLHLLLWQDTRGR